MNLALKPELEKFVDEQVKAGRFDTPEAVVAAALTRLMQDDDGIDFAPGELQAMVDEGEADIARGDVLTLDQVRANFHRRRVDAGAK